LFMDVELGFLHETKKEEWGVLENYVLRRTTQGWRNLNNEELHNLHSSPITIRMIK
jgi:hypothetical protein